MLGSSARRPPSGKARPSPSMVSAEPRNGQGDSAKWNVSPGFSTSCRDCISPPLRGASTLKGVFNSPHNASDRVSTQAMSAESRAKRSSSKPSALAQARSLGA